MAQNDGRREVVNDPLAVTGREQRPDHSLALQGVRAPNNGGPASTNAALELSSALGAVGQAFDGYVDRKKDDWIAEGKMAYMAGTAESALIESGNRFTHEGFLQLKVRDDVNKWFMDEAVGITEASNRMAPADYQKYISGKRAEVLAGIEDPYARKVAVKAFEEFSPKLVGEQFQQNNEFERNQRINKFGQGAQSLAATSTSRSRVDSNSPLALSDTPVLPVMQTSDRDRDIAIRTMLGEAGGEGATGMAAVAHVMRNRAVDGRWPKSIAAVGLQDKQFSAWNVTEGGNSLPRTAQAGDASYERAGAVYDAVMSGRHVDPTNGATHYYSPRGMNGKTPTWAGQTSKESRGSIKIGGHVFSGKANIPQVVRTVLDPVNPNAALAPEGEGVANPQGLDTSFNDRLSRFMADAPGGGIKVNSGFRTPERQAEIIAEHAGKYGFSRSAWEADVKKLGPVAAGKKWRPEMRKLGVTANIAMPGGSNHQKGLAADLGYASDEQKKWAHDNAEKYGLHFRMGHEPWHIEPLEGADHGAQSGIAELGAPNDLQDYFRNYPGLNANDRATAAAAQMAAGLKAGDDTVFRDGGGIGLLIELGATPTQIAAVQAAETAYQTQQMDKFDADFEMTRSDILKRAGNGADLGDIMSEVNTLVRDGVIDDAAAKSLARAAADAIRTDTGNGSELDGDLEYQTALGNLYQQITAGDLDFEAAGEAAKALGDKFGAPGDYVNEQIGRMFNIDQQRKNGVRADAQAAAAKFQTNEQKKTEVATALARGAGLNLLTGNIDVQTADGKSTMSAQQFGINAVRDKHIAKWSAAVENGTATNQQAIAGTLVDTFVELQKQGVVDPETQAQFVGALTGNITNADGTLDSGATEAYDTYTILRKNPQINDGYLSRLVGDEYVRGVLETAYMLDEGAVTGERALIRAHQIVNDPLRDPAERITKDAVWRGKLDKGVEKVIRDKGRGGFFERAYGMGNRNPSEQATALLNTSRAQRFVVARAEALHLNNPNLDAKVALEMATQDLEANSALIGGNLIITPNTTLAETMGIEQFGTDAPDEAVMNYIAEYGKDVWGEEYTSRFVAGSPGLGGAINAASGAPSMAGAAASMPKRPPMQINFNPVTGLITVDLYKDATKGTLVGMPREFRAVDIGKEYYNERTKPSGLEQMFNGLFGEVRRIGEDRRNIDAAAKAGADMGASINK